MLWRSYALTPPSIRKLLELYPNVPVHEPPYRDTSNETFTNYSLEWRRDAAINGDLGMIAQRCKMCGVTASAHHYGMRLFRYWTRISFQNISGALGSLPQYQSYKDLSTNIGRAYVSFVREAIRMMEKCKREAYHIGRSIR